MSLGDVVFPENVVSEIPVVITVDSKTVRIKSEKNDTIIDLVKSKGYEWEPLAYRWAKYLAPRMGTPADRAAEIGNKLLNAGFPIEISDEKIRENAINADFEPECTRWILLIVKGEYKGRLIAKWFGKDNELYRRARSLPQSRWHQGEKGVLVKIEHYKEVEDFASVYGFKFSSAAKTAIEEYREEFKNARRVKPVKVKEKAKGDGLGTILQSSREIIPDLLDT